MVTRVRGAHAFSGTGPAFSPPNNSGRGTLMGTFALGARLVLSADPSCRAASAVCRSRGITLQRTVAITRVYPYLS